MNYLIVSDQSEYKIANLVETHKNHIQVILLADNSKRKFGIKQQICNLNTNNISQFITQVSECNIDIPLLFELIEDTTNYISISDLSILYFGENYSEVQMVALLTALAKATVDFDNNQAAAFKKSNDNERSTKQQEIDRILLEQTKQDEYYNKLRNAASSKQANLLEILHLTNPDILKLINRPDKNLALVKALNKICGELNVTPLEFCHNIGLVPKLEDFFIDTFKQDNFPRGIKYNQSNYISDRTFEYNSSICVFSIDDSNTTEIDDAFSVQKTSDGHIVGIHIASPALNPELLDMVTENISTIYYPGHKITMLGKDTIDQYSLDQGRIITVVSIYFKIDHEYTIQSYDSKVEQVMIKHNLRIETLETLFNNDNLEIDHGYLYEDELKILYHFANKLEEKRGKPSVNTLFIDYNFSFKPDGKIDISKRIRGNPIDKLVSELMILANCTWGRMLTNAFIPAIYRVKQQNFPVKMTTNPASHVGLNVDYYTWATSPLRRSADFINQHQIISLVTGSKDHYTNTSHALLEVVENFDNKYSKYIDFQNKMERYWSLGYLLQENISEIVGTFLHKSRVQLDGIPLEIDTNGFISQQPKGSQIKIRLFNINLAKLTFEFKILD